jgi:hypothetical protein
MANYSTTLSKLRANIESAPERLAGFTNRYNVQYSDVALSSATGSTDTVTVTIGTTPALWVVDQCAVVVKTAFAGTGGLTIQVGTSGTANAFLAAASVLSTGLLQNSSGFSSVNTPASSTSTSSATMQAVFTNSTSGSPSAISAGELDIYISLLDLTRLG